MNLKPENLFGLEQKKNEVPPEFINTSFTFMKNGLSGSDTKTQT